MAEVTFGKPYLDVGCIRTFDPSRDDDEFVWHVDLVNRELEVLEGEGWQFQLQNCLPWLLEKGMIFDVKGHEYHRLIKGVTPLKIRIINHGI